MSPHKIIIHDDLHTSEYTIGMDSSYDERGSYFFYFMSVKFCNFQLNLPLLW